MWEKYLEQKEKNYSFLSYYHSEFSTFKNLINTLLPFFCSVVQIDIFSTFWWWISKLKLNIFWLRPLMQIFFEKVSIIFCVHLIVCQKSKGGLCIIQSEVSSYPISTEQVITFIISEKDETSIQHTILSFSSSHNPDRFTLTLSFSFLYTFSWPIFMRTLFAWFSSQLLFFRFFIINLLNIVVECRICLSYHSFHAIHPFETPHYAMPYGGGWGGD